MEDAAKGRAERRRVERRRKRGRLDERGMEIGRVKKKKKNLGSK